jgi:transposase InsO family protein
LDPLLSRPQSRSQHESARQLLGQCGSRIVFQQLKKGAYKKRDYKTRDLARADIFDYTEMFYNPTRRHTHLGGISPDAFEAASQ